LLDYGRSAEALEHLTIAANFSPHDPDIQYDLGIFYLLHDQPENAAGHFIAVLNINPFFPQAEYHLAQSLARQHKSSEASPHYREALYQTPYFPEALNELAWILATDPVAANRSGAEAVQLAKRACELTQNRQPAFLATLAAAYAEDGQFAQAIATIQASTSLATSMGKKEIAEKDVILQKTFQSGNPFREK
jgi:predicted Zn-dependent protease